MKYFQALLIKFVVITAVLWIVLGGFFGVAFTDILWTGTLLTVVSFIGDLLLLPRISNIVATIADLGLAWFAIWLIGTFLFPQLNLLGTAAFLSAIGIAIGEFFIHRFIINQIINEPDTERNHPFSAGNLQTEFSSEIDDKSRSLHEEDKQKD